MMMWLYKTASFNEQQKIAKQNEEIYNKKPRQGGNRVGGKKQGNDYDSDDIDNEDTIFDPNQKLKKQKAGNDA